MTGESITRVMRVGGDDGPTTRAGNIQVKLSPGVHKALEEYAMRTGILNKAAAIRVLVLQGLGVDRYGNKVTE